MAAIVVSLDPTAQAHPGDAEYDRAASWLRHLVPFTRMVPSALTLLPKIHSDTRILHAIVGAIHVKDHLIAG